MNEHSPDRRRFLENGIRAAVLAGIGSVTLIGCNPEKEEKEIEPAPTEDLMQEHGILNRILLIYDECGVQFTNGNGLPRNSILGAANIIRTFIEDYHEKQEEDFLFPRMEKAEKLTDLVNVLRRQHEAGRRVTDHILQLCRIKNASLEENQELARRLRDFTTMYRPHEAREDTVLFPAFRQIVSRHEYDALGEEFEKNEHKLFGEDGFERIVSQVAAIEKDLGIYQLELFTPQG